MLVGYMRVSTSDERQSVDLQRDALLGAGIDERHLPQDRASGARDDRPGLKACMNDLRAGDVLVVWKLDRLGRSRSFRPAADSHRHLTSAFKPGEYMAVRFPPRSLSIAERSCCAVATLLKEMKTSLERQPVCV